MQADHLALFIPSEGFLMKSPQHSWYLIFILLMFAGYAVTRSYLGSLSSSTFYATIRYNTAAMMFKDNSQLQRQRDNVLSAFYFISVGFYLMLLLERIQLKPFGYEGARLFLLASVILMVWYYLKSIILTVIGEIFKIQELLKEFLYQGNAYNKLLGIVFLPLNFIFIYTTGIYNEIAFYLSLSILGIVLISKYIRGVFFSLKKNVFNFYMFLYLWALEIVPLLLLYKWFMTSV
ncbi:DUF4271 domain-containing protein [Bacteroidota bacterium]